jgi:hypothetical protein
MRKNPDNFAVLPSLLEIIIIFILFSYYDHSKPNPCGITFFFTLSTCIIKMLFRSLLNKGYYWCRVPNFNSNCGLGASIFLPRNS